MKALTCEMCGSTDLIKQDGVYVCQSCGTKYSVEEAKKLMVDIPDDMKGTVHVNKSNEIQNYLSLAQSAIDSVNGAEAYSYANRALEIEPQNAQAWFLKMKAAGLTAILKDLKVLDVIQAGNNAIKFSNGELKKDVYTYFLTKCLGDLKFCMTQLTDTETIKRLYDANVSLNAFKATENTLAADTITELILQQVDSVIKLREMVPNDIVSNDPDTANLVGEVAKQWVYYTNALNDRFNVIGSSINDATVEKYRGILARIKEGLPEEHQDVISEEEISNPSKGPCYIATAVYGSYDCPEVWTLRRFRDSALDETFAGRLFIKSYYAISPTLVRLFGKTDWFKAIWKPALDKLVSILQNNGFDSTPYNDKY